MTSANIRISEFIRSRYGLWEAHVVIPSVMLSCQDGDSSQRSVHDVIILAEEAGKDGLSAAQCNAISHFVGNFEHIYRIAIDRLFQYYSENHDAREAQLRGECDRDTLDFSNPVLYRSSEMRELCDLQIIHLHHISSEGLACCGLEFRSSWNPENGVGVLMHGNDVIAVGAADVCVLPWMVMESLLSANKSIE